MSLPRLLNQPLTLRRWTTDALDEYGNMVEGAADTVIVYGYIEQTDSTETLIDRDTVVTNWTGYVPADTEIGHLDYITFEGNTFQVNGAPNPVYNPRLKRLSHQTVKLTSVLG
jgi:hypothetical protein